MSFLLLTVVQVFAAAAGWTAYHNRAKEGGPRGDDSFGDKLFGWINETFGIKFGEDQELEEKRKRDDKADKERERRSSDQYSSSDSDSKLDRPTRDVRLETKKRHKLAEALESDTPLLRRRGRLDSEDDISFRSAYRRRDRSSRERHRRVNLDFEFGPFDSDSSSYSRDCQAWGCRKHRIAHSFWDDLARRGLVGAYGERRRERLIRRRNRDEFDTTSSDRDRGRRSSRDRPRATRVRTEIESKHKKKVKRDSSAKKRDSAKASDSGLGSSTSSGRSSSRSTNGSSSRGSSRSQTRDKSKSKSKARGKAKKRGGSRDSDSERSGGDRHDRRDKDKRRVPHSGQDKGKDEKHKPKDKSSDDRGKKQKPGQKLVVDRNKGQRSKETSGKVQAEKRKPLANKDSGYDTDDRGGNAYADAGGRETVGTNPTASNEKRDVQMQTTAAPPAKAGREGNTPSTRIARSNDNGANKEANGRTESPATLAQDKPKMLEFSERDRVSRTGDQTRDTSKARTGSGDSVDPRPNGKPKGPVPPRQPPSAKSTSSNQPKPTASGADSPRVGKDTIRLGPKTDTALTKTGDGLPSDTTKSEGKTEVSAIVRQPKGHVAGFTEPHTSTSPSVGAAVAKSAKADDTQLAAQASQIDVAVPAEAPVPKHPIRIAVSSSDGPARAGKDPLARRPVPNRNTDALPPDNARAEAEAYPLARKPVPNRNNDAPPADNAKAKAEAYYYTPRDSESLPPGRSTNDAIGTKLSARSQPYRQSSPPSQGTQYGTISPAALRENRSYGNRYAWRAGEDAETAGGLAGNPDMRRHEENGNASMNATHFAASAQARVGRTRQAESNRRGRPPESLPPVDEEGVDPQVAPSAPTRPPVTASHGVSAASTRQQPRAQDAKGPTMTPETQQMAVNEGSLGKDPHQSQVQLRDHAAEPHNPDIHHAVPKLNARPDGNVVAGTPRKPSPTAGDLISSSPQRKAGADSDTAGEAELGSTSLSTKVPSPSDIATSSGPPNDSGSRAASKSSENDRREIFDRPSNAAKNDWPMDDIATVLKGERAGRVLRRWQMERTRASKEASRFEYQEATSQNAKPPSVTPVRSDGTGSGSSAGTTASGSKEPSDIRPSAKDLVSGRPLPRSTSDKATPEDSPKGSDAAPSVERSFPGFGSDVDSDSETEIKGAANAREAAKKIASVPRDARQRPTIVASSPTTSTARGLKEVVPVRSDSKTGISGDKVEPAQGLSRVDGSDDRQAQRPSDSPAHPDSKKDGGGRSTAENQHQIDKKKTERTREQNTGNAEVLSAQDLGNGRDPTLTKADTHTPPQGSGRNVLERGEPNSAGSPVTPSDEGAKGAPKEIKQLSLTPLHASDLSGRNPAKPPPPIIVPLRTGKESEDDAVSPMLKSSLARPSGKPRSSASISPVSPLSTQGQVVEQPIQEISGPRNNKQADMGGQQRPFTTNHLGRSVGNTRIAKVKRKEAKQSIPAYESAWRSTKRVSRTLRGNPKGSGSIVASSGLYAGGIWWLTQYSSGIAVTGGKLLARSIGESADKGLFQRREQAVGQSVASQLEAFRPNRLLLMSLLFHLIMTGCILFSVCLALETKEAREKRVIPKTKQKSNKRANPRKLRRRQGYIGGELRTYWSHFYRLPATLYGDYEWLDWVRWANVAVMFVSLYLVGRQFNFAGRLALGQDVASSTLDLQLTATAWRAGVAQMGNQARSQLFVIQVAIYLAWTGPLLFAVARLEEVSANAYPLIRS